MYTRAVNTGKRAVLSVLLGIVSILTCSTAVWATTKFGTDVEVQAWYRMRQTFQTDGKEHFDWVQWRNEAFVWLTYDNIVKNGQILGSSVPLPFVEHAELSARFRARVDPVYYLRDHYRKLYDENHQSDFFAPEKMFRDLYIDMDHGQVGPGVLSSRIGYQQIVWGESDLYRSLDIINPLRIDQSFGIGEKFDEFRTPILAAKLLYQVGGIGDWLSEVGIEPFYSPRWRGGQTNLLLEDGWRIQFQERGCLDESTGKLLDYSPENCANSRHFLPYRPNWVGWRRQGNPWSVFAVGPTGKITAPDFACVTQRCASDVAGDRISVVYDIMKGRGSHHARGTNFDKNITAGVRVTGKTWFGMDFSLNYIFIPVVWGDGRRFPANRQLAVYGDFPFSGVAPQGTFEEGLRACLSESGKSSTKKTPAPAALVVVTGADLRGYDWPERRLDAKGNLLPSAKQPQAARVPITICANTPKHSIRPTHVLGFTATYNDFDYTGAILRIEESVSTSEYMNRYPAGYGAHVSKPGGRTLSHPQGVWRSMVGFDLLSALRNYRGLRWTRSLPGKLGEVPFFLSFQWLMLYYPATSNNFCNHNNGVGIGPSLPSEGDPVRPAQSGCRNNHWNHFFTFGGGGAGFFGGKLEQRLAVALEPRGQQWLLYGQWWWREFLDLPVDLSFGTSWLPGSRFDNSWTALNYFTNRNLLWFEGTYYIL